MKENEINQTQVSSLTEVLDHLFQVKWAGFDTHLPKLLALSRIGLEKVYIFSLRKNPKVSMNSWFLQTCLMVWSYFDAVLYSKNWWYVLFESCYYD